MAVPKRKMSRSNTRHRRSQWKAVAPTLVTCANPACGAKHLPHRACGTVRPVRRPRRPSPGPLSRTPSLTVTEHRRAAPALGDPVLDPELLDRALTHRSYAYENGGLPTNERLEFLGDSVLGVVVTETLYLAHPDLSEGRLAKLRAAVVNARALAEVAREHRPRPAHQARPRRGDHRRSRQGVDPLRHRRGRDRRRSTSAAASRPPPRSCTGCSTRSSRPPPPMGAGLDWKTSLQELSAELGLGVPEYVIEDEGPDHVKTFTAQVRVGEQLYGNGTGRSKKEAEQGAAETAYGEIRAPTAATAERSTPRRRRPCLSCPRSRSSAPASSATSLGATHRPGRGPAPAPGPPRPARARPASPPRWPAGGSRRARRRGKYFWLAARQTATRCSATSA